MVLEKPERRRRVWPTDDIVSTDREYQPSEEHTSRDDSEADAVLDRLEREEEKEIRRKARETKKAELELKKKEYEQALRKMEHPAKEEEESLTPDETLKLFKMLDDHKPEIVLSATQKLFDYNHLRQYKGLQRVEAALVLAKMFPPKLDEEAMWKVMSEGVDFGIKMGKKMAEDATTVLILNKMDEKGYFSAPGRSPLPLARSGPASAAPSASPDVLRPALSQGDAKPPASGSLGRSSEMKIVMR